MLKKIMSMGIALSLLFTFVPSTFATAENVVFANSMIGKYLKFGSYQGQPVVYRVVYEADVNQDGENELMLMSENIISYKAYDSNGDKGTFVKEWDEGAYNNMKANGSARWDRSAVRSWLNSSDKAVNYDPNSESPAANFVVNNPYNAEIGFMADGNMTATERSLIVPVVNGSMVSKIDTARDSATAEEKALFTGTLNPTDVLQNSKFDPKTVEECLTNYGEIRKVATVDKVFIPSIKEYDMANLVDKDGTSHKIPTPTEFAKTQTNSGNKFMVRDELGATEIRYIHENGKVAWSGKCNEGNLGVRPAMYIKGNLNFVGMGTIDKPCVIDTKIGKCINFGSYNGEPVTYRVAQEKDVNHDGKSELMLVAENIISYKAYDSNGDTGVHCVPYNDGAVSAMVSKGSSRWDRSTIRYWLNSSDKTVNYGGFSDAPSGAKVINNPYDTEKGFMADGNMTSIERGAIVPVTHKSLMTLLDFPADNAPADEKALFGGKHEAHQGLNDPFGQNKSVSELMTTYEDVYNKQTEDKVFFLSIKELAEINLMDDDGNNHIKATATASASGQANSGNQYLLRDAYGSVGNRYVTEAGLINYHETPREGKLGVRPAMYIKGNLNFVGSGTAKDPYVIDSKIGKYFKFGSYQGQPVVYRVVYEADVNQDGENELMLMSENIISYKAYDSNGDKGTFVKKWDEGAYNNMKANGSARWDNSTVRSWLNSSDKTVNYNPNSESPAANFVVNNPYDTEIGFMADGNMTATERSLIVPVVNGSMVSEIDTARDEATAEEKALFTGTLNPTDVLQNSKFDPKTVEECLTNYGEIRKVATVDKVFIPSIKEYDMANLVDTDGTSHKIPTPTEFAKTQTNSGNKFMVRDELGATEIRYIHENGKVAWSGKCNEGNLGVRPAMYIENAVAAWGDGTLQSPYEYADFVITSAKITDKAETLAVDISTKSAVKTDVNVYTAFYDNNNKLLKCYLNKGNMSTGTISFEVDKVKNAATHKVFIWGNEIVPFCGNK